MKGRILYVNICFLAIMAACISSVSAQPYANLRVTNEKQVNSKTSDFSPMFWEDGLVFVTNRPSGKFDAKDIRLNKNNYSLFQSSRNSGGKLDVPVVCADKINTKFNEGPVSYNATQDIVFFCRNNISKSNTLIKDKKDIARMNLFTAHRKGDAWTDIKGFDFTNTEYDFVHPSISPDGNKLYFSSNCPGGYGGMDLYVVEMINGKWGEMRNLGPNINTKLDEVFPFIHADGTLFFSSDGFRGGVGKLDIYYAHAVNGLWGKAKNIGPDLNSKNDDFGFIADLSKKNGYFSSNRGGGVGDDDIYSFSATVKVGEPVIEELPPVAVCATDRATGKPLPNVNIEYYLMSDLVGNNLVVDSLGHVLSGQPTNTVIPGKGVTTQDGCLPVNLAANKYLFNLSAPGYRTEQLVRDMEPGSQAIVPMEPSEGTIAFSGNINNGITNMPLGGATITLTDDETGATQVITTTPEGNFNTNLPCGKTYSMKVEKDGYMHSSKTINSADCSTPIVMQEPIALISATLMEGDIIQLPNIYYNFNDASIRSDATQDLDALAVLLNNYTDMEIELSSHTDARGSDIYNKDLSQRRAESARVYLMSKGISEKRIVPKGYGESRPRSDCRGEKCNELAHQINRRTEFKVLKAPKNITVGYRNNGPSSIDPMPGKGSQKTDEPTAGNAAKVVNNVDVPPTAKVNTPAGDEFLVIAGTFSSVENAEKRLMQLTNLGLKDAEIVHYSDRPLHAVCVQRFTDFYAAQARARELAHDYKIEVFVRGI